jgi:glycerol 3-phosphatase-2
VRPLCQEYDTAVLDLDGVVYIGEHAVPGAPEALADARGAGMHLAFVTNNAARPPSEVALHLAELGIEAGAADVVTSAQAAAGLFAAELPAGSAVFVIGGPGLEEALRERGLVPVTTLDAGAAGVVQGYGPDMPWSQVVAGSQLVRQGLPWVATNTDLTLPTAHGPGPGNGSLVRLVAEFSGREPRVAGKPRPPLFRETIDRVGGERPLVVGDRIDTDIEGAHAVGWDSLLVMTGVTVLADLALLAPDLRPTYVGADLSRLAEPATLASSWAAAVRDGRLVVTGEGAVHAWWQAAAGALWSHLDATGRAASVDGVVPGSVAP